MEAKNLRSILQDILLGIKPFMLVGIMLFSMSFSNQNAIAGDDYFSKATVNTLITFHINKVTNANETVLSEILQSGLVYVPADLDGDSSSTSSNNGSYKMINQQTTMKMKLYNHVLEQSQNMLKIQISQDIDDGGELTAKDPLFLVTSENIAGKLPQEQVVNIGTADVSFSNGIQFTFDVYIYSSVLTDYINNQTAEISNTNYVQNMSVNVFPNPTSSLLNVNVSGSVAQISAVNIINLIGVKVMSLKPEEVHQSMQLNVSDLPQGIYYLSVETGDVKQNLLKKISVLN